MIAIDEWQKIKLLLLSLLLVLLSSRERERPPLKTNNSQKNTSHAHNPQQTPFYVNRVER